MTHGTDATFHNGSGLRAAPVPTLDVASLTVREVARKLFRAKLGLPLEASEAAVRAALSRTPSPEAHTAYLDAWADARRFGVDAVYALPYKPDSLSGLRRIRAARRRS